MTLHAKDVAFGRREIIIRKGKGGKDRVTMLPIALVTPLRKQIEAARSCMTRIGPQIGRA